MIGYSTLKSKTLYKKFLKIKEVSDLAQEINKDIVDVRDKNFMILACPKCDDDITYCSCLEMAALEILNKYGDTLQIREAGHVTTKKSESKLIEYTSNTDLRKKLKLKGIKTKRNINPKKLNDICDQVLGRFIKSKK